MTVDVTFEERYWYPDAGGQVWIAGYTPVDAAGRYLARDAPELLAAGLHVAGVAGAARHHTAALESDGASPGERLLLRREPENPHDPNAIAVLTASGERLGFVPRELAVELDAHEPLSAIVLRERRDSPRDPRTGVTMLLARGGSIELRVR